MRVANDQHDHTTHEPRATRRINDYMPIDLHDTADAQHRPRDVFDLIEPPAETDRDTGMARVLRRFARGAERACCLCATYFPLAFVYGLTTWALYVVVHLATTPSDAANTSWVGPWAAYTAFALWTLLVWSYTTAVFSSPGSTTNDQGYSTIPASLSGGGSALNAYASALTVKANGELRFCKKCQARKPDRAHHCSTCRRCVLKMDHHCPWLANCIGLNNAKAFLLFLIYTTVFACFCCAVTAAWMWTEIAADVTYSSADDSLMPVQYIMLCVIGGIIGLVIGLFTGWHIFLACRGQTTIEAMEKTRYSSPLRSTMTFTAAATVAGAINDSFGGLRNRGTVPGLGMGAQAHAKKHDEEGGLFSGIDGAHDDSDDEGPTGGRLAPDRDRESDIDRDYDYDLAGPSGQASAAGTMGRRLTYDDLERYRAQKRYEAYMDEQDSKRLPHAFDLGVRGNLRHMFGPQPLLWPFPVRTTTGDGWTWDPSPKWLAARDRIQKERDAQMARERAAGWGAVGEEPGRASAQAQAQAATPSNARAPPIFVTTATPPRPRPQPTVSASQQQQHDTLQPRAPPSRYRRPPSPSNSSNPASASASVPTKADRILGRTPGQYADGQAGRVVPVPGSKNVALQRLTNLGHTADDDLLASDSEKDEPGTTRAVSPLRARWMPDPTSGLLRKASSASMRSPSGSGSPAASPITEAPRALPDAVNADLDDGSVD